MADLESDDIRLVHDTQDIDLSDETQDFRFLQHFNNKNAKSSDNQALPKRGEKDFEPDGTDLQDRVLRESRKAMHDALCGERIHTNKVHIEATWRPEKQLAEVSIARGSHFKSIGRADSNAVTWLLPEETIYMVERGNLECWWEEGIPMSLQGVYASCLEYCGGLERYQVYAYLKRAGYILLRAPTFFSDVPNESLYTPSHHTYYPSAPQIGLFKSIFRTIFGPHRGGPSGPLIKNTMYQSYDDIYANLAIIPCHHPGKGTTTPSAVDTEAPFRVAYNVWKPQPHFKKSDPGEPDFRIAVVSARDTPLPTLPQLSALFDSIPFDKAYPAKNQFQKLKDGHKNIIIAIVDSGVTSFIKFGDVGFGDELIYKRKPPVRKSGGGGRGGRGGRGGARGGRGGSTA
ncbi:tRNA-splicing endonuclease subunit sen54 N-term-domain-containing protein [Peziza echinospora]|nr:tRNA-splicing endonuclease subunit sen54 N-term-domain-containing protein [Peziza echinospora]